jgi:tellurite resistance protein TerC
VELWIWAALVGFILALLALDLFVFHRQAHEVSIREASTFRAFYLALGLAFAGVIAWWRGSEDAGAYLAGSPRPGRAP